jgi:hypothetical protein
VCFSMTLSTCLVSVHDCYAQLRTTNLDALCNDLCLCELCVMNPQMELLPQVRRRHLHEISCVHKGLGGQLTARTYHQVLQC